MANEQGVASILGIDCGTVLTKAALLDRVRNTYCFVARGTALTTVESPWRDVTQGAAHAVEQIEDITGRRLLDERRYLLAPQQGSTGTDVCVVTSSAAPPIRLILAGLVPELSLAGALRAALGTYCSVEGTIARDPRDGASEQEAIRLITEVRPDVVCIVGGTDGGAAAPVLELVETVALACSVMEEKTRPRLLFAGNSALRQRVVDLVGGRAEVRSLDNVLPALGVESPSGLRAALDALYRELCLGRLPGGEVLAHWSTLPITPTAEAFTRLIQYLWYLDEAPRGTLGIDLGAASTTIVAVFDGHPSITIRSDLGALHGGSRVIQQRGTEAIGRWVPLLMKAEQIAGTLLHRTIWPASVAQEAEELWVEQAAAREVIREALQSARSAWQPGRAQPYPHLSPLLDPILVTGGALTGAASPGQTALMVLDAVEPIGVSTLLVDPQGLAALLGAVGRLRPLAAVETLDTGGIVNLATTVVPVGVARPGEIVLRIRVRYEGGGALEMEVPYGSLEMLPLPPGQEAVLEIHPRRHFDVGLGGPGKGGKRRVRGGLAGLIVDARGRPLQLADKPDRRVAQMRTWLWDVGG